MTNIEAPWIGKSPEDYDERKTLYHCAICGAEIKEGDDYYDFYDTIICTKGSCVFSFVDETYLKQAEAEENIW